jgi:glycosyltransferase involved in cell wall biosynthesis
MADKIMTLLDDDEERRNLSKKADQRARQYSRMVTAEQTANVIKSVVPKRYAEISQTQIQISS